MARVTPAPQHPRAHDTPGPTAPLGPWHPSPMAPRGSQHSRPHGTWGPSVSAATEALPRDSQHLGVVPGTGEGTACG